MDLTPVYELRERLKTGAVAGTGLIAEDFRLKRAVEAVTPLEKASPVFAKIVQLSTQALEENCEDRAGTLLEALTLVDALLCTQGVVEEEREIKPLAVCSEKMDTYVANVPYSVLSTLLDALQHSGGGRYSYVVNLHKEQPALFQDYRVRAAMVDALGASYAELAEEVAGWLIADGRQSESAFSGIRFLLERGFDPKGKKEMVRRVQVMESVAGAEANDFYVSQLAEAKKEVRTALIYALRHSQENEELLLSLCQTEAGNNKKMAYCALARMEGEKTWAFFRELAAKKPVEALSFLEQSKQPEAAELVSDVFQAVLDSWQKGSRQPDKELEALLDACLQAFPSKGGAKICDCYRRAAAIKTEKIPEVLQYSMLQQPRMELALLAEELYRTYGEPYFPAAMTAALYAKTGAECLTLLQRFVEENGLFGRKIRKDRAGTVKKALSAVKADTGTKGYVLCTTYIDSADLRRSEVKHPIGTMTGGMFDILMKLEDVSTDLLLASWIQPDNEEMCRRLASYFYIRASKVTDNRAYLAPLRQCHAQNCKGLAVHYFKGRGNISAWEISSYMEQLPGSAAARAEEAGQLRMLMQRGSIKGRDNCMATLEAFIQAQKEA